jgi:hypothetical protein
MSAELVAALKALKQATHKFKRGSIINIHIDNMAVLITQRIAGHAFPERIKLNFWLCYTNSASEFALIESKFSMRICSEDKNY